jgi:hypothetical protein
MTKDTRKGWKKLIEENRHFRGEGNLPRMAYSEFMSPLRIGYSPLGEII